MRNARRRAAAGAAGYKGGMFRRKAEATKGANRAKTEPFTYIQRGTTIEGELVAEGRVRVHGVVRGNVRVAGTLEVAEAGLVEGQRVEADEVKIIGRVVVERLEARGKVEIWSGGELVGDVSATSLDIEEGARFTGRSEMAGASLVSSAPDGASQPEPVEDAEPLTDAARAPA